MKIAFIELGQRRGRLQVRMEREPKLRKRFDELSDQLLSLSRKKI